MKTGLVRFRPLLILLVTLAALACATAVLASPALAAWPQGEVLTATVEFVKGESQEDFLGQPVLVQQLELTLTSGARRGQIVTVEHRVQTYAGGQPLLPGDLVYMRATPGQGQAIIYELLTPSRWPALVGLGLVLAALVLGVGRGRGLAALIGLGLSFLVIFAFVLPRLEAGHDPFWVSLAAAALAMPPGYLLAHGPNLKTGVALLGSLLGIVVTGLLAVGAVAITGLTGYAAEEAGFLQALSGGGWDVRGLLLAGMMVGVLGVLDDITVAQAGTVQQLHHANPTLRWRDLYNRAMHVGQDHIASMVNTLALVYAGASLPLLILLRDASAPLGYLLSQELIAEEIVRMLVTSCGLVAAVPVTTALAALAFGRRVEPAATLEADAP